MTDIPDNVAAKLVCRFGSSMVQILFDGKPVPFTQLSYIDNEDKVHTIDPNFIEFTTDNRFCFHEKLKRYVNPVRMRGATIRNTWVGVEPNTRYLKAQFKLITCRQIKKSSKNYIYIVQKSTKEEMASLVQAVTAAINCG